MPALALGPVVEQLMLSGGRTDRAMTRADRETLPLFDPALVRPALGRCVRKLDPRVQWRNPVMFVVYVGSAR